MKSRFTSFYVLLSCLIFFTSITAAVSFTPTSDPTGTNTGQSSQLVNFSIQNTGTINITQLNITLPPGFTFTGASGTTTTSPYTASLSTPSWTNSSSIGIVGNGTTQYFWIYVNTPSTNGSFGFNITTLDASATFSSSNVTFSLFDTIAPFYSSNTTSPSTNTTYSINQSYWFNITWSDGLGMSKALIEHNITGSGTPHNETMSNSSSVYYFNVTDLAAGTYVWRVYANDTNNTFNSTPQFSYSIRQATNNLNVFLNGALNKNVTAVVNTGINVTVNTTCTQSTCTITIARDGTNIVSGATTPYYTNDTISSVGSHYYTVNTAGNVNYTNGSSTYYIAIVPSYSTSTSNIPVTYSNSTTGTINITFTSNPSLSNVLIQGDWSGTATNYTMPNSSGTNYYFNATFPAGTSTWKIYGNYSGYLFNLTGPNSFTINKAAPNITLSVTPQWTLDIPVQTNASCTVGLSGFTAYLYRNGTLVTNPDVQTFSAGSTYEYLCNNTVNQNYTSDNIKNILKVRATPLSALNFVQTPTLIEIVQNSSATSEVKVKNTGNTAQNVTLGLLGIDKSWYSISPATFNIFVNQNATFTITFTIGNADIKDYSAKFNMSSSNATVSQDFTLRVLPSAETKLKINDTLTLYKLDASKLENKLNEIKTKINNTAAVEQKLEELKSALKQAEDYINSNNYFQAQQKFETIKSLISEIESQLKVTQTTGAKVEIPSKVWLVIGGVAIVIVVGILLYLFLPAKKGYKPETKEYIYGGEKRRSSFDMFKNLLSKFKRKKKTETVLSGS